MACGRSAGGGGGGERLLDNCRYMCGPLALGISGVNFCSAIRFWEVNFARTLDFWQFLTSRKSDLFAENFQFWHSKVHENLPGH